MLWRCRKGNSSGEHWGISRIREKVVDSKTKRGHADYCWEFVRLQCAMNSMDQMKIVMEGADGTTNEGSMDLAPCQNVPFVKKGGRCSQ